MGILFMKVFKSLLKFLIFIRFSELGWKLAFIHFIVINVINCYKKVKWQKLRQKI